MTHCPNCNAEYKSGVFSTNNPAHEAQVLVINEFTDAKKEQYCGKCGPELYQKAWDDLYTMKENLKSTIADNLPCIPVNTLQAPMGWNYKVVGMATAQSVTGTGVFSEFASALTDLVGAQSNRYGAKLAAGESICISQLRIKALEMGGNAIIATDIDYNEVGGDKGMLMVCMAGTVVNIENPEVISKEYKTSLDNLLNARKELSRLYSFKEMRFY